MTHLVFKVCRHGEGSMQAQHSECAPALVRFYT
jgi:hypothetical protein